MTIRPVAPPCGTLALRPSALCLGVLVFAIACGEDASPRPANIAGGSGSGGQAGITSSSGSGGQAGSTSAGGGGGGGSAGTPSAGGGGGSAGTPSAGGSGGQAGIPSAGGSSGQAGGSGADGGMVRTTHDLSLARSTGGNWPHAIDVYAAADAKRALVLLHGGGGKKDSIVQSFGLVTDGLVDAAWLQKHHLAVVVPQGQRNTSEGVDTWTNGVMKSGVDDRAFLIDLAATIRAGGLAALPAIGRVYVAGHSNGGMMANDLWCKAPSAFDAYGALSGPAAKRLDALGSEACSPETARPYLGFVGSADVVLRTTNNWNESFWTITPTLTKNPLSWDDPDLVNEERFHDTVRAKKVCDAPEATPIASADGKRTSWSSCGSRVRLERVEGASHGIDSLEAESGLVLREELLVFFEGSEKD